MVFIYEILYVIFQYSPYASSDNHVKENRILKNKYAQMKAVASKERQEKIHAQNRCAQLERALFSAQAHLPNRLNGGLFAQIPQMAPTSTPFLPMMMDTPQTIEKESIESIEVPEYLK